MGTRKKISLVFIFLAVFLILGVGTQTFAKKVGYHKSLGKPLFIYKNKIPIYWPGKYISWLKFKKTAPKAIQAAENNMMGTFILMFLILIIINYKKKVVNVHGSAKWATKSDINKMGFFPYNKGTYKKEYKYSNIENQLKENIYNVKPYIKIEFPEEKIKLTEMIVKFSILEERFKNNEYKKHGVYLGKDQWGRDLIDMSPGHVMLIAKTGGGKDVSVVIPTLLTWKGSTITNDVKGEDWLYTAAYRRSLGHKVLRFHATADGKEYVSCHYNPMVEIRKGTLFEYEDARLIAMTIVSPDKLKDKYFGPSGVNYLAAVILHVLYMVKNRIANLTDVYNFITSPQFNEDQRLVQMIEGEHNSDERESLFYEIYNDVIILKDGLESPRTHPRVSRVGRDILDRADKERSGIIGTAKIELETFAIPTIARNTAYSDFRISDLMNYEVPVDLYFVTPPNSVDITSVLLKLFINQIIFTLTRKMELNKKGENIAYKHRLLFLMNELAAIGRVDLFHKAIAYMRGYGMKALIIIQDMKQLKEIYGENNSFLGNMSTTIYYTTNDVDTAKYVETRLGNKTEKIITKSYGHGGFFRKVTYNESYVKRPLMTAEEVHNMGDDDSVILNAGKPPIKGVLNRWYKDDELKNRIARATPLTNNSESDIIKEYR